MEADDTRVRSVKHWTSTMKLADVAGMTDMAAPKQVEDDQQFREPGVFQCSKGIHGVSLPLLQRFQDPTWAVPN